MRTWAKPITCSISSIILSNICLLAYLLKLTAAVTRTGFTNVRILLGRA